MRFNIDLYSDNLMLPEAELRANGIQESVITRILRLRDIYNYMLRNPLKKEREYIDYIRSHYREPSGKELSRRKAYEDIEILHAVIGNLQQCTKEWHRWRFNNMIMEGYAIALRHEDGAAIAKLAATYGKYNQLDRNDERDNGLNEIPHLILCFDVTVLGFRSIPNVYQRIDELISYYAGRLGHIVEDADAIEISNEPSKLPVNADTAAVPQ